MRLHDPNNRMKNENMNKRRVLIASVCASLMLVLALAVFGPLVSLRAQRAAQKKRERTKKEQPREQTKQAKTKERPAAKESPAAKEEATPATSSSEAATELGRNIDHEIDASEFASAHWGVFVLNLRDGRVIYAREAGKPFTPASNMKAYTTAVALDQLGADYRWRTSVYAAAEPDASGTIDGDLVLYGRGAPDLTSRTKGNTPDRLAQLADDLYRRGVRHVRGNVVGDESYFQGEALGDGWLWNDVQWYFGAEVSALSINGNEATLTITSAGKAGEPASVKFDTPSDYLHVINDTSTAERGRPLTIGVTRGLSDNDVRVWGDFRAGGGSYNVRISVHKPALWAATLFRDELNARGIKVDGDARMIDARTRRASGDEKSDASRGVELASITGKTLGEIVRPTNKESLNFNAELILRTLGKERGATAPDSDPVRTRIRGDDQAGLAVMRLWLERAGVPTDNLALHDGSGLSRLDLVTPEATARLMAAIAKTPSASVFRDSLPVAGRDGTLRGRLGGAAGRIQAKTGTLTYTNSLSGYVTTADNETLAFAIICNDETERESSTKVIDAIATLLAKYSER